MTADEYRKLQEANQKVYELLIDQEEKRKLLASMMEAELNFVQENQSAVEVNETILGQSLNITMKPDAADKLAASTDLLVISEKVTPENVFDRVSAKNAQTGESVDLKQLLGNNPESLQEFCNLLNAVLKTELIKDFGNQDGLQLFENDEEIGFKRTAESFKNPDLEVDNIVNRARGMAASHPQESLDVQPELEQDDALKPAI